MKPMVRASRRDTEAEVMLTPRIRLVLAVLAFSFGTYRVIAGDYWGLALLAASALLAYGHFKYGTVWLAFRAVARGQTQKAEQLLRQVRRPAALGARERAYFELASGFVCVSHARNEQAEKHLRLALANELGTSSDRALAEAVLAQLLVARGELSEARAMLDQARARSCRPAIAQRIQALRDELTASD
jgi:ATP/maltotriose-dependent transcriptional regulator MalT